VIYLSESNGISMELMKFYIDREIKESDAETTVFRANSFATKLFKPYSKLHGLAYLFQTLAEPLVILEHETKETDLATTMEVDPDKLEEGADDIANKWQLMLTTQKVFDTIIHSVNIVPASLRDVTFHVKIGIQKKYPNLQDKAIGAFWFLRFFCPAIVAPHMYGLLQNPPSSALQRELVLLSKVLQNLANGVLFGNKEPFMEKLNDFLIENKTSLSNFYLELAVNQAKDISQVQKIEVPTKVVENTLYYMHNLVANNLSSLRDHLDPVTYSQLKEVMEELGNPPDKL